MAPNTPAVAATPFGQTIYPPTVTVEAPPPREMESPAKADTLQATIDRGKKFSFNKCLCHGLWHVCLGVCGRS